MWALSPGLGCYLAFYTYPRMGLAGLWAGLGTGMSLLLVAQLLQIASLDWEAEARRVAYLISKTGSVVGTGNNAYSRGIVLRDVSVPAIGSRSTGGFSVAMWSTTLEEQLDELEFVEAPFNPQQPGLEQQQRHPQTKNWIDIAGIARPSTREIASLLSGADSKDHDSDGDEGDNNV